MEIIKSVTSFAKRGAIRVQNFVKNHQGVVRTALMLLLCVSVTSVMAQTSAGSAGTKAFTSVTADLKSYVPLCVTSVMVLQVSWLLLVLSVFI